MERFLWLIQKQKDVYEIQGLQGGVMAMIPIPEKKENFWQYRNFILFLIPEWRRLFM